MNKIDEKFEAVHAAHPEIYQAFKEVALDIIARGFKRFSQDGIMHIVRYTKTASAADMDKYKCNNDFVSRYARMFIAEFPQYSYLFQLRELKSAA